MCVCVVGGGECVCVLGDGGRRVWEYVSVGGDGEVCKGRGDEEGGFVWMKGMYVRC